MKNNYVKILALTLGLSTTLSSVVKANEDSVTDAMKTIQNDISLTVHQENKQAILIDKTAQTSNVKRVLMKKLAKLSFFSANFTQKVFGESGEMLEQSSGKLAISKPNLANWHTLEPDELEIVSDGQDVWFYDPWIEQVSIYSLSAAIAQTPILLLTSQDEILWQEYNVTNNEDGSFVITAKNVNSQIRSLTLRFDSNKEDSKLNQFSFLDATGQLSHIKLTDFDDKNMPEENLFKFVVPEGIQIDDQRDYSVKN